jgi:hypothetical protein
MGGLPSEATHYGIQRLPPDSELYTPRRMVPTGYRVPSPIVQRKPSCLRRLSLTCSPYGDEYRRQILRLASRSTLFVEGEYSL